MDEGDTALKYYHLKLQNELFDFDCNLTHPDLVEQTEELIKLSFAKGITKMLVPGATFQESQQAIALAIKYPNVLYPTVGIHPYNAHAIDFSQEKMKKLIELATTSSNVVAIGECGLDFSPSFPPISEQLLYFAPQLDLASELKMPLFLHERLAHDRFVEEVKQCKERHNGYFPPAVVHCFTGTESELRKYVDMGFYIGVTGFICKKSGTYLKDIIQHVPLDRLLIETDAPYMGFPKCRIEVGDKKKQYPNTPLSLLQIVDVVATCFNTTPAEIASITMNNSKRFLRL